MAQQSTTRNITSDEGDKLQLVATAETLETFYEDVGLLWSPKLSLPKLNPPSALEFSRSFVSRR